MPDVEEYIVNERALYFDLDELPFPIALNMEMLRQQIRDFDYCLYKVRVGAFLNTVGNYEDGHASEHVAEYIERKCRAL